MFSEEGILPREHCQHSRFGVLTDCAEDHSSPSCLRDWSQQHDNHEYLPHIFGTGVCQLTLAVPLVEEETTLDQEEQVERYMAFRDSERDVFGECTSKMVDESLAQIFEGCVKPKPFYFAVTKRNKVGAEWKWTVSGVVLCNPRVCDWSLSFFHEGEEEKPDDEEEGGECVPDVAPDDLQPRGHILTCPDFLPPDFDNVNFEANRDFRLWIQFPSSRKDGFCLSPDSPRIELSLQHLMEGSLQIRKFNDLVLISISPELFPPESVMMVPLPRVDPAQDSMKVGMPESKSVSSDYSVLLCGYPAYPFFKYTDAARAMRCRDLLFDRYLSLAYVRRRFCSSETIFRIASITETWTELIDRYRQHLRCVQLLIGNYVSEAISSEGPKEVRAARRCPIAVLEKLIRILTPLTELNSRARGWEETDEISPLTKLYDRVRRWERLELHRFSCWRDCFEETRVCSQVVSCVSSFKDVADRISTGWNAVLQGIADSVQTEFFPGPCRQDGLLKFSEGKLFHSSSYPGIDPECVRAFVLAGPGFSGGPLLAKKMDETSSNLSGFVGIFQSDDDVSTKFTGLGKFISSLYKTQVLPDVMRVMDRLRQQRRRSVGRVLFESLAPQIERLERYFEHLEAQKSKSAPLPL